MAKLVTVFSKYMTFFKLMQNYFKVLKTSVLNTIINLKNDNECEQWCNVL